MSYVRLLGLARAVQEVAVAALLIGVPGAAAHAQFRVQAIGPPETPFGYADLDKKWPSRGEGQPTFIPVCWENPSAGDQAARDLVESTIRDTWSEAAPINFTWGSCGGEKTSGIRIQIADAQPGTKSLGTGMAGVDAGMVLNFVMSAFVPTRWCVRAPENRKECIKAIAVHEFGHALALAHEHNRPDKPRDCPEDPQGPMGTHILTPWDRFSVMNYCNSLYTAGGWKLSKGDVDSIVTMYGARQ